MLYDYQSKVMERARERGRRAQVIANCARDMRLDANVAMVLRNFRLWEEWYYGRYSTGYLIRKTGVGRICSARTR